MSENLAGFPNVVNVGISVTQGTNTKIQRTAG